MKEFGDLILPLYQELYQFILAIVHSRILAEDIVQNTFIQAYENFMQLKEYSKFKSWIFTIGKRQALKALKEDRSYVRFDDYKKWTSSHSISQTLEEFVMTKETVSAIRQYICELDPINKSIITLYYYHNFSLKEISCILELNYNTINVDIVD